MKEIETIVDITEPDEQTKENLVEQSGIKIWLQPKNWREKITENKKLSIAIGATVLIFLFVLGFAISSSMTLSKQNKTIATLEEKNDSLESDLVEAEKDRDFAEGELSNCRNAVETAWRAWDRRNGLIATVFDNIFTGETGFIEQDNSQAVIDFVTTKSCNPYMDVDDIFKSSS